MPDGSSSSYRSTSLNRRTTISTTLTRSSEEIELDECRKQFRAKPLPDPASRSSSRREENIRHEVPRNLTTLVPFNLHTNLRDTRPVPPSTDEVELSRQFKARPMPIPPRAPAARSRCLFTFAPSKSISYRGKGGRLIMTATRSVVSRPSPCPGQLMRRNQSK